MNVEARVPKLPGLRFGFFLVLKIMTAQSELYAVLTRTLIMFHINLHSPGRLNGTAR